PPGRAPGRTERGGGPGGRGPWRPSARQLPHRVGDRVAVAVQGRVVDVRGRVARGVVAAVEGPARCATPLRGLGRGLGPARAGEQAADRDARVLEGRVVGAAVALGLDLGGDADAREVVLEGLFDRGIVVVDEVAGVRRADHVEVQVAVDARTVR